MSSYIYGLSMTNFPTEILSTYMEITKCELTETITSLIESSLSIGSAIGCAMTSIYVSKLGLTKTLLIMLVLNILMNILSIIPIHWVYIFCLRIVIGISSSSLSSLSPLVVSNMLNP